ncbi:DUF2198 family protein [Bacillus lacus]|uniref:DUF2198 family protein n=1 Tax=Metabacillus lacus TaxID=1983721 RepID=A0A7X2IZ80_9BACI|nr:DUF2198 family protein [Metabacillus lacus]MRX72359.1 DUF2198 family protein [Metabacillus lacus]
MIVKALIALFLPFLLVVFFTRVTYSRYIGALLTAALLAASVYSGYTDTVLIGVLDVLSLIAGFLYAKRVSDHLNG